MTAHKPFTFIPGAPHAHHCDPLPELRRQHPRGLRLLREGARRQDRNHDELRRHARVDSGRRRLQRRPGTSGDGIMHARLVLPGGAMVFAGDTPPGMPYEGMKGVMLAIQYDTIDQAHGAFHALSQGGQVTMPLAPAFWAKTFGMLTDRFGVSWAVNGEPV